MPPEMPVAHVRVPGFKSPIPSLSVSMPLNKDYIAEDGKAGVQAQSLGDAEVWAHRNHSDQITY